MKITKKQIKLLEDIFWQFISEPENTILETEEAKQLEKILKDEINRRTDR